jgi:hypothetical protein
VTRTVSHNNVLSLGSCIIAALTVPSGRTVAPLSSRSCLALTNRAWLTASQVSARRAPIVWMTRLLRRTQILAGAPAVGWHDRRRLAKKRARAIEYSRGSDKKRQLLAIPET